MRWFDIDKILIIKMVINNQEYEEKENLGVLPLSKGSPLSCGEKLGSG